jgi:O-antigen/teichoic acid export membrane protein
VKNHFKSDQIPSTDSISNGAPVACVDSVSEPNSSVHSASETPAPGNLTRDPALRDLKKRTARGALVSTVGQATTSFLRIVSMVALARLLVPQDFGLVGMATVGTGFLALFQDIGLSMATVQRASITHAQISTLFWINLGVSALLAALCAATAPLLVHFYHEPRLFWVTVATGLGFVLNGAGAQHRALLQRNLRFMALTLIDITALFVSVLVGIVMAATGFGYWSIVGMTLCGYVFSMCGSWLIGGWRPGLPRRGAGVRSMLGYGGIATLNNLVVYFAYNSDKVLLGRFFGAETLGIYGRAFQLINLPTQNLNSTIALVAFPALSRLQNEPERLRSYFLKGYGLFLSLVIPITMACALFSEDIIRVFLGAKWSAAVPVFRLMAPTILGFALINPFGWLLMATGRAVRSFKISLLIAPVVFLGYLFGLRYGSNGVAAGFSSAIMLLVVPVIVWSTRGCPITALDALGVAMRPFVSALVAGAVALAAWSFIQFLQLPLLRLIAANLILFGVYAFVLLFVMGQKTAYVKILRELGVWPSFARRAVGVAVKPADV